MASTGAGSLAYAVRGSAVLHLHGELCRALVFVPLIPVAFAAASGDWAFAGRSAAAACVLAVAGAASMRLPRVRRLQLNEAMVTVALGYLLTALLMSWPLAADGIAGIDAFFHSMSAITTTGLSTVGSVEVRSASFLFTQAWMQWCGGLVVVVLALLLLGPGPEAQRLSDVEGDEGDLVAGTRRRARWALLIYSTLTAAGIVLLLALGCGWFDALVHVLSAVSTGGFSSHDTSIAGLGGWPVQAMVMLLALGGAVPLARYRSLASGNGTPRARLRQFFAAETRTLLLLCALASLLLTATLVAARGIDWQHAVADAALLAVSAQSTAGFTPTDVGRLDQATKLVLIAAMFIGGGLGSTAGGIKIFRLLVTLRAAGLAIVSTRLPTHAVVKLQVSGRNVDQQGLTQALGIIACFLAVTVVSWFAFLLHGHDAIDALFEVASATGTVGLSAGIASPSLAPALKLVLCADMWMGRLEILAVLVLFSRGTWIGRRAGSS
jgi:trk system potassium uptake protein TrkH